MCHNKTIRHHRRYQEYKLKRTLHPEPQYLENTNPNHRPLELPQLHHEKRSKRPKRLTRPNHRISRWRQKKGVSTKRNQHHYRQQCRTNLNLRSTQNQSSLNRALLRTRKPSYHLLYLNRKLILKYRTKSNARLEELFIRMMSFNLTNSHVYYYFRYQMHLMYRKSMI